MDGQKVRDVDCVLATVELEKLIEEKVDSLESYISKGTIENEGKGFSVHFCKKIVSTKNRDKNSIHMVAVALADIWSISFDTFHGKSLVKIFTR